MSRVLPILFNTEMVRAILEDRKTCTRRIIKPQPQMPLTFTFAGYKSGTWGYPSNDAWKYWGEKYRLPDNLTEEDIKRCWKSPCNADDILYVRETFCYHEYAREPWYGYKADGDYRDVDMRWTPSIHMPKEAARIFLKVKNVRVERLQDITEEAARSEGCIYGPLFEEDGYEVPALKRFPRLWNSTIKKSDEDAYGWDANPWVWVIEFERCEKPENF